MQKISPIHWFILEMQILESQDLKDHAHFLSPPSKNYQLNFWLSWIFFQYIKHQFNPLIPFWDTANFSIIRPEWPHPFLTMATPIFFNQPFNFHYSLSTCKKNQAFSSFVFLRYSQFKNAAIWLAKNILAHISGTRSFQSMG